jgi:hypothetical protein
MDYVKNFNITPTTCIEVYEQGTARLMFKSLVNSAEEIGGDVKFKLTGNKPTIWSSGKNFSTADYYSIMIYNLTRK